MRRLRVFAAVALAVALPAAAHTFGFPPGSQRACLTIGNTTWRFTGTAAADVVVRVEPTAGASGLRIKLAATPDDADFVLVDDGAPPDCRSASSLKDVSIAPPARAADLVVAFTSGAAPADYRIYVRSRWIAPETAAALFAAAHMPPQKLAGRSDPSN